MTERYADDPEAEPSYHRGGYVPPGTGVPITLDDDECVWNRNRICVRTDDVHVCPEEYRT